MLAAVTVSNSTLLMVKVSSFQNEEEHPYSWSVALFEKHV